MDVLAGLVGLDDPRIVLDLDHSVRRLKTSSRSEEVAVYGASDSVSGTVSVFVNGSLKYSRISIELRGETATKRCAPEEFFSMTRVLDNSGVVAGRKDLPFTFAEVDKDYETFESEHVRVRYFLRVNVIRYPPLAGVMRDFEVAVQHEHELNDAERTRADELAQFDLRYNDLLDVRLQLPSQRMGMNELVQGQVEFVKVGLPINAVTVEVIRLEASDSGAEIQIDTTTEMGRVQILDWEPILHTCVPVHLDFGSFPGLSPTYNCVNNQFSVRYYLKLELAETSGRKFSKTIEIFPYREPERQSRLPQTMHI
ncbi:hypothetical protein NDN08_000971 [Rhodosorus marinus]|uniref:Vacuolar protein sorting-associated protein 26 n=1 Tax=Rhodosorus marinus TaxID=101924 RepID=A0AAV8UPQ7_9RHOD|nr:hypothetical protein NDN08_000971 [Rhodosorus marinus]